MFAALCFLARTSWHFILLHLTVLLNLFNLVFALLRIQIDVLLFNEFLQLMNLFTVHIDAHLVGCGDQIRVDYLHIIFVFTLQLLVIFFSILAFLNLVIVLNFLSVLVCSRSSSC